MLFVYDSVAEIFTHSNAESPEFIATLLPRRNLKFWRSVARPIHQHRPSAPFAFPSKRHRHHALGKATFPRRWPVSAMKSSTCFRIGGTAKGRNRKGTFYFIDGYNVPSTTFSGMIGDRVTGKNFDCWKQWLD